MTQKRMRKPVRIKTDDGATVVKRQFAGMKLFAGGKYVSVTGSTTRVIERIDGGDIYWCDESGPGRCTKGTFRKWAGRLVRPGAEESSASESAGPQIDRHATNELLQVVLTIQGYLVTYGRMIGEMARSRDAVLTPTQKETYPMIVKEILGLEARLEQLRHKLEG